MVVKAFNVKYRLSKIHASLASMCQSRSSPESACSGNFLAAEAEQRGRALRHSCELRGPGFQPTKQQARRLPVSVSPEARSEDSRTRALHRDAASNSMKMDTTLKHILLQKVRVGDRHTDSENLLAASVGMCFEPSLASGRGSASDSNPSSTLADGVKELGAWK